MCMCRLYSTKDLKVPLCRSLCSTLFFDTLLCKLVSGSLGCCLATVSGVKPLLWWASPCFPFPGDHSPVSASSYRMSDSTWALGRLLGLFLSVALFAMYPPQKILLPLTPWIWTSVLGDRALEPTNLCLDFLFSLRSKMCSPCWKQGNCRGQATDFPSLRDYDSALAITECLKTVASYVLSILLGDDSRVSLVLVILSGWI